MKEKITVGLAQVSPIWLNKELTTKKTISYIKKAAKKSCDVVGFGEAFLPAYPFWLEKTDGARFESNIQKDLYAHYLKEGVCIENRDLESIQQTCQKHQIATVLGIMERPLQRGGHTLYCSCVFIDKEGVIQSVHRKLVPTYEERLAWGAGDGHGLRVHPMEAFTLGALNCWENWLPLARTALYAQGEDLHFAIWPGSYRNTEDITRFIAKEGRSFVVSVSSILHKDEIPNTIPHYDILMEDLKKTNTSFLADGGSCVANPDGTWLIEPQSNEEKLIVAELDHRFVRRERQNMDNVGHYSRPDVLQLRVNRERQSSIVIKD